MQQGQFNSFALDSVLGLLPPHSPEGHSQSSSKQKIIGLLGQLGRRGKIN